MRIRESSSWFREVHGNRMEGSFVDRTKTDLCTTFLVIDMDLALANVKHGTPLTSRGGCSSLALELEEPSIPEERGVKGC